MAAMTPERIAEIRKLIVPPYWHSGDRSLLEARNEAIADLLAERETLLADARRWKHIEKLAFQDGNGGDWCVEVWPHDEVPEFSAAVDQDIERTAILKGGGP